MLLSHGVQSLSRHPLYYLPFSQICLGEMIAYLPIAGGFIKLAERFVDPAFSFTVGWNYWYSWVMTFPTELSAAAVLMSFWKSVIYGLSSRYF